VLTLNKLKNILIETPTPFSPLLFSDNCRDEEHDMIAVSSVNPGGGLGRLFPVNLAASGLSKHNLSSISLRDLGINSPHTILLWRVERQGWSPLCLACGECNYREIHRLLSANPKLINKPSVV
jgi:hypothetical protein